MRTAFLSPFPPKRTGIAEYSMHLARALFRHGEITLFDSAPSISPLPGQPVLDYVAAPELLLKLADYDAALYHFGNNPYFHLDIFRAFLTKPGVAVLHDSVLYFLMAGLGRGGMLREFLFNYGVERLHEFFAIENDSIDFNVLRYRHPERYPLAKRITSLATAIIVHSESTARRVRALSPQCDVHVVPFISYPPMLEPTDPEQRATVRRALKVEPDEILLGAFGFLGPSKRFPAIFAALAALKPNLRFKLLIVGDGAPIHEDIAARGLENDVILAGFVSDDEYARLLRSIDILVNLRFPSMGETSAPQNQAMACGIPTIVSDNGWFSELPADSVWRIPVDETETDRLKTAIEAMASDIAGRSAIGRAGQAYVKRHCAPDFVAQRYMDILRS